MLVLLPLFAAPGLRFPDFPTQPEMHTTLPYCPHHSPNPHTLGRPDVRALSTTHRGGGAKPIAPIDSHSAQLQRNISLCSSLSKKYSATADPRWPAAYSPTGGVRTSGPYPRPTEVVAPNKLHESIATVLSYNVISRFARACRKNLELRRVRAG